MNCLVCKSSDLLGPAMDAILAGVLVIEKDTNRIAAINGTAAKLLGIEPDNAIGSSCRGLICQGPCLVDQSTRPVESVIRLGNKMITVLRHCQQISIQGRDYLVESLLDISELRQENARQANLLEQLELANKELKEFAYVVSHDLKAPLRGIKSLATWIASDYADRLDDEGRDQLKLLVGRVSRLEELIDGILQYSRAGRPSEQEQVVDLAELVPAVVDILSPPPHIKVTIEQPLPKVRADKTRMIQVFQNLINNAIKFMDKPEGLIRVGCTADGAFWRFHVADNGPGIDSKHFDRIFQLFQTLAPKDDSNSTGVGLAVVKKIITFYRGRIWVESQLGKGSTFLFTLPNLCDQIDQVIT